MLESGMTLIWSNDKGSKLNGLNGFVNVGIWDNLINITQSPNHLDTRFPVIYKPCLWLIPRNNLILLDCYGQFSIHPHQLLTPPKQLKVSIMQKIVDPNRQNYLFHCLTLILPCYKFVH